MSMLSTMEITRKDALEVCKEELPKKETSEILEIFEDLKSDIVAKILCHGLSVVDDEELATILERLVGDDWRKNFQLVKDYSSSWHIKYRNSND